MSITQIYHKPVTLNTVALSWVSEWSSKEHWIFSSTEASCMLTRDGDDIAVFTKNFVTVRMSDRWCVKQKHQWHGTPLLLLWIQWSYVGDKDLGKGGLFINTADK